MATTSVPWMGNRVQMSEIDGTELTAVEWTRPGDDAAPGTRVLGEDDLDLLCRGVEEVIAELRPAPRLDHRPDRPLDLEAFIEDLLGR